MLRVYSETMDLIETENVSKGEWVLRCAKALEKAGRLQSELTNCKQRHALELGRKDTIIFNLRERLRVLQDTLSPTLHRNT